MKVTKEQQAQQRRSEIIDAAFRVFAEKGFTAASNREIAAAAGLATTALIYHYFPSKEELLAAVVREKVPAVAAADAGVFFELPPREALTLFGWEYLRLMENPDAIRFFKLSLAEAVYRPELNPLFNSASTEALGKFMGAYLTHQMERGTIRRADPLMLTLCYIGPMFLLITGREISRLPDALALDTEVFLATVVETFLQGWGITPPAGEGEDTVETPASV
jgi:AcrR family transcriptional regulator